MRLSPGAAPLWAWGVSSTRRPVPGSAHRSASRPSTQPVPQPPRRSFAGLLAGDGRGFALLVENLSADVRQHLELPDPGHEQGDIADERRFLQGMTGPARHDERASRGEHLLSAKRIAVSSSEWLRSLYLVA